MGKRSLLWQLHRTFWHSGTTPASPFTSIVRSIEKTISGPTPYFSCLGHVGKQAICCQARPESTPKPLLRMKGDSRQGGGYSSPTRQKPPHRPGSQLPVEVGMGLDPLIWNLPHRIPE